MDYPTRGERREKKKHNRRKMKVDGRSVFTLDQITRQKAKKAKQRRREWGDCDYDSSSTKSID